MMPGSGSVRRAGADRRMRYLALCRCLAIGLLVNAVCVAGASAHAVLLEALPADGARLEAAPAELVLRFNEPVVPMAVKLLDGQGAELAGVAVEPGGETVVVRPSGPLPKGAYFLSYRVASLDAHPVAATLRFGIGADAGDLGADARPGHAVGLARCRRPLAGLRHRPGRRRPDPVRAAGPATGALGMRVRLARGPARGAGAGGVGAAAGHGWP